MKLDFEERNISTNMVGEEIKFELDADSPIIFDILRKRMYTDPIGSICREVSDNARDAHREVGTPSRSVEISLPGEYLVIRDFGPGMSPERVRSIYCSYGKSTKRDTNAQGGGFGMGAKTPFSYTDTFTVETVCDGKKYVYISFIDDTLVGRMKLISEENTQEHSGTRIKIPVKHSDRSSFTENIIKYTQYWWVTGDAVPKYIGGIIPEAPEVLVKSDKWIVFNTQKGKIPDIIYNGIPYGLEYGKRKWPPGVTILFSVGELDLSSSRETLHYSDKTNQKLQSYNPKEIEKAVTEKVKKDLDLKDDPWDAIKIVAGTSFNLDINNWKWKDKQFKYPFNDKEYETWTSYRGKSKWGSSGNYSWYSRNVNVFNNPNTFLVDSLPLTEMEKTAFAKEAKKNNYTSAVLLSLEKLPILEESKLPRWSYSGRTRKGTKKVWKRVKIRPIGSYYEEEYNLQLGRKKWVYFVDSEISAHSLRLIGSNFNICSVSKAESVKLNNKFVYYKDFIDKKLSEIGKDKYEAFLKRKKVEDSKIGSVLDILKDKVLDFQTLNFKNSDLTSEEIRIVNTAVHLDILKDDFEPTKPLEIKYPLLNFIKEPYDSDLTKEFEKSVLSYVQCISQKGN